MANINTDAAAFRRAAGAIQSSLNWLPPLYGIKVTQEVYDDIVFNNGDKTEKQAKTNIEKHLSFLESKKRLTAEDLDQYRERMKALRSLIESLSHLRYSLVPDLFQVKEGFVSVNPKLLENAY